MSWTWNPVNNIKPASHANPVNDRYGRIYFDNESITMTWTGGTEVATWELRNYFGVLVGSGPISGGQTSLVLGILPPGFYKLYWRHANPAVGTPVWGDSRGEVSFFVCRSNGPLRNTPIPNGTTWSTSNSNGIHPSHAITGMAQYRVDVDLDSEVGAGAFASTLASAVTQGNLQNTWKLNDPVRPRPMLIHFADGTGGSAPTSTDNSQIQQAVTDLYPLGYTYFEMRNEPNTGGYTAADVKLELEAFYNNVKAANSNAKVLGGCSVTATDNAYIGGILAAGAGPFMDEMSVHVYNATNGSLGGGRDSWNYFKSILAQYNFTKPLYMTEYGQFAWCAGSFEPRLQAQWMMLDLQLAAQNGIPHEKYMWFYDTNVGFWGYPSFMWTNDQNNQMPTASPAIFRVWAEEIWGRPWAAKLNFGPSEDEFIGNRFTHADGTSVVSLQSGGGLEDISFDVTGAVSLTRVGTFGDLTPVAVSGGKVELEIGPEPIYVRLPSGATMVPSAHDFGVEVLRSQYAIPTASSNDASRGSSPAAVMDGNLSNGGYSGLGPKIYFGADTDSTNAWVRLSFPKKTRLDRIHVFCPHPWQHDSTLLDFDIQYLAPDGVTWLVAATFTDTSASDLTINWSSHQIAGSCFSDSFWDRRHIFRFALANAIETDAIRVFARNMTNGGGARPEVNTGFGKVDGNGVACNNGQTGPKRMSILEIRAYLTGKTDGGTAVHGQPLVPLNI